MKNLLFCFVIILAVTIALSIKTWIETRRLRRDFKNSIVDLDVIKFNNYMVNFNKSYTGKEFQVRLRNFKESLDEIARLNALEGSRVFGLTKFSDLSPREFSQRMTVSKDFCFDRNKSCTDEQEYISKTYDTGDIPKRFDWRDHDCNTPVQDQKLCNGCWAFAIAGVMECMAIKRGKSHDILSVQEILDCSNTSNKCFNGYTGDTLLEFCDAKMYIANEAAYPLTLKQNSRCINMRNGIRLKSIVNQCHMNEEEMLWTIANHGPLTTVINGAALRNYVGGIIRRACGYETILYHALQIVGYDKSLEASDLPYYILKNSMGETWGEGGYIRVAINNNTCGISDEVGYLNVE